MAGAPDSYAVSTGNILLVEDEVEIAGFISNWLTAEGHNVRTVHDGRQAMSLLSAMDEEIDLVILDLLLPGIHGMDICRRLRMTNDCTPILILTAKNSVEDKEQGLDAGADDYLTKPFHLRELAARARALLRRPRKERELALRLGNIVVNTVECSVRKDGELIHLLPQEYKLLEFLMRHRNQVFSAEALFNRLWEPHSSKSLDTVRGHIQRLRTKLDTHGHRSIISTVRRFGYRLN